MHTCLQIRERRDGPKGGDGKSSSRQEGLFAQTVLCGVQCRPARPHPYVFGDGVNGGHGDVLKLERHHMHMAGEVAQSIEIIVGGCDLDVGNLARRRVGLGGEGVDAVAHAPRRDSKHPPQLSATEHADRRTGQDGRGQGSVSPNILCVCSARNWCSFSRSSGRWVARMATASNAALVAPAGPMARVPTGMPAGICTMERSESIPFRAWLSTGTPRMGSVVWAAAMPGRWAAPPAPAIITSMPRASAPEANSANQAGVRCAETMRHSCGTPNRVSTSSAWRIVSQSDLLPMITATSGLVSSVIERPLSLSDCTLLRAISPSPGGRGNIQIKPIADAR